MIEIRIEDREARLRRIGRAEAYTEIRNHALQRVRLATTIAERDAWDEIAVMARKELKA